VKSTDHSVHFIMDEDLLSRSGHSELPAALKQAGHIVHLEQYKRTVTSPLTNPVPDDMCAVLYGSIGFVEQRMKLSGFIPGAYYSSSRFRCSHYLPKLPLELIGNRECVYLPFGDFGRRHEQIYRLFGVSRLFIRPDSGGKTFTGLVMDIDKAAFEISSLRQLTSVTDETLVMIAPAAILSSEYRFFIVDGEVVTGSRYHVNGLPAVNRETDTECQKVAEAIAGLPWQLDLAYACDVGFFDGEPKVVELNAFSTSGLYACDALKLFGAVSDVAIREYQGLISLTD
jgi:hypothetical protein